MRSLAVTQVECVEGCGDSTAMVLLAFASAIVSLAAFTLAYRAWKTSVEQRDMMKVEHDALLKQLSAYAALKVKIHLEPNDAADQKVEVTRFDVVIAIAIQNEGTKAATNVLVNVVAPTYATLTWSDAQGMPHLERGQRGPTPTGEQLHAGDAEVDVHYLDAVIGRIGLSTDSTVLFVRAGLELGPVVALDPEQHQPAERYLPVRVEVSSDDMPEARQKVEVRRTWRFWRAPERG